MKALCRILLLVSATMALSASSSAQDYRSTSFSAYHGPYRGYSYARYGRGYYYAPYGYRGWYRRGLIRRLDAVGRGGHAI
jgi:hypothetical protein